MFPLNAGGTFPTIGIAIAVTHDSVRPLFAVIIIVITVRLRVQSTELKYVRRITSFYSNIAGAYNTNRDFYYLLANKCILIE